MNPICGNLVIFFMIFLCNWADPQKGRRPKKTHTYVIAIGVIGQLTLPKKIFTYLLVYLGVSPKDIRYLLVYLGVIPKDIRYFLV